MEAASSEKLATFEDYATTNFEAWKHEEGEWEPPSNEEWAKLADPHLIAIRVAWIMLYKSKPELIDAFRSLEKAGAIEGTLDRLQATADFLKGLRIVIRTAQVRFLSAGAAFAQSEGEDGQ